MLIFLSMSSHMSARSPWYRAAMKPSTCLMCFRYMVPTSPLLWLIQLLESIPSPRWKTWIWGGQGVLSTPRGRPGSRRWLGSRRAHLVRPDVDPGGAPVLLHHLRQEALEQRQRVRDVGVEAVGEALDLPQVLVLLVLEDELRGEETHRGGQTWAKKGG